MTVRTGPLRELLGPAVSMTALAGLACALVAPVLVGRPGVAAAAAGCMLVLAFLLVGQVPVHQAGRGRRRTGAALLVLLYALRVLLCLAALSLVTTAGRPGLDRRVLGVTVVVCALAWTAGTVWAALRWRPLVVVPDGAARQ